MSAPRDLVRAAVAKYTPLHPTVFIFHCTFVCDARCEMCSNWTRGNRKEDMTLEQIEQALRVQVITRSVDQIQQDLAVTCEAHPLCGEQFFRGMIRQRRLRRSGTTFGLYFAGHSLSRHQRLVHRRA